MPRLRPLTEAECYARLYGGGDPTVTVIRIDRGPERPRNAFAGEELRRLFEERLDAREPDRLDEAAA